MSPSEEKEIARYFEYPEFVRLCFAAPSNPSRVGASTSNDLDGRGGPALGRPRQGRGGEGAAGQDRRDHELRESQVGPRQDGPRGEGPARKAREEFKSRYK